MNKLQLVEAISERVGDKKTALAAVDAIIDTVMTTVANGEKVAITGFGSWEAVTRPAREARNPATGQTINVPATTVPKWKAGQGFKDLVAQREAASR
ncbi:HU family DNA-binding protein [Actinoallomurus sp. NPDC052274]|uniref:HU family DNA-binding protein n=1 Tax=Actinoallomurus sp. NPDC052274 TaxID=3155420 RepID=UPI003431F87E